MSAKDLIDELTGASAVELFRSLGIELAKAGATDAPVSHAAVIGFSAAKMRGMVGLGTSEETLRAMVKHDCGDTPKVSIEDWLGESANQLLGRLTNKLTRYGVVMASGLPTILRGIRLQVVQGAPGSPCDQIFEGPLGLVHVWADAALDPSFALVPTNDPEIVGRAEGEILIF